MIKRLTYLGCGLLGLFSIFFAYATIGFKFIEGLPIEHQNAFNEGLKANGGSVITFFEKIGDFRDTSLVANSFDSILASLLVFLSIMCVSVIFISSIISIIKQSNDIFKVIEIKWISIIGFTALVIALILGLAFGRLPESPNPGAVVKYTQSLGIGAILCLVAFVGSITVSFLIKEEN